MRKQPSREPRKFTDVWLRNVRWEHTLAKDGREYEISDTQARGLRVVLWPSGEKSLIVRYRRPDGGKSAKLSLGWVPLAAARQAAANAFEELRHGRDPGVAKQTAKAKAAAAAADTVQAVCEEYMAKAGVKLRSHREREKILVRLV